MMLLGMSLMAADVTFSGQSQFEWFQDFGPEYQYNADAELVATVVVDDYNTAKIDFQFDQDAPAALELDPGTSRLPLASSWVPKKWASM
jgi:hypothetical protein